MKINNDLIVKNSTLGELEDQTNKNKTDIINILTPVTLWTNNNTTFTSGTITLSESMDNFAFIIIYINTYIGIIDQQKSYITDTEAWKEKMSIAITTDFLYNNKYYQGIRGFSRQSDTQIYIGTGESWIFPQVGADGADISQHNDWAVPYKVVGFLRKN